MIKCKVYFAFLYSASSYNEVDNVEALFVCGGLACTESWSSLLDLPCHPLGLLMPRLIFWEGRTNHFQQIYFCQPLSKMQMTMHEIKEFYCFNLIKYPQIDILFRSSAHEINHSTHRRHKKATTWSSATTKYLTGPLFISLVLFFIYPHECRVPH